MDNEELKRYLEENTRATEEHTWEVRRLADEHRETNRKMEQEQEQKRWDKIHAMDEKIEELAHNMAIEYLKYIEELNEPCETMKIFLEKIESGDARLLSKKVEESKNDNAEYYIDSEFSSVVELNKQYLDVLNNNYSELNKYCKGQVYDNVKNIYKQYIDLFSGTRVLLCKGAVKIAKQLVENKMYILAIDILSLFSGEQIVDKQIEDCKEKLDIVKIEEINELVVKGDSLHGYEKYKELYFPSTIKENNVKLYSNLKKSIINWLQNDLNAIDNFENDDLDFFIEIIKENVKNEPYSYSNYEKLFLVLIDKKLTSHYNPLVLDQSKIDIEYAFEILYGKKCNVSVFSNDTIKAIKNIIVEHIFSNEQGFLSDKIKVEFEKAFANIFEKSKTLDTSFKDIKNEIKTFLKHIPLDMTKFEKQIGDYNNILKQFYTDFNQLSCVYDCKEQLQEIKKIQEELKEAPEKMKSKNTLLVVGIVCACIASLIFIISISIWAQINFG